LKVTVAGSRKTSSRTGATAWTSADWKVTAAYPDELQRVLQDRVHAAGNVFRPALDLTIR